MSKDHGQYIIIIWDCLWQKYGKPVDTEVEATQIRDKLIEEGMKPADIRITRLSNK